MKKLWFGVALLLVLLCLGIGASLVIGHTHDTLSSRLEEAAALSQTDWGKATDLANAAATQWAQHRHWVAALAEHEPLEEISSLFSQLALCQSLDDRAEFAAVALRIAGICDTLSESHALYWWNLL